VLRRLLLCLGVVLLALAAVTSGSAVGDLWRLRQVRIHGQPPARTAQEDYAWNPYWLKLFARLNAISSGVLLASGSGLLMLRRRFKR
jgi:hypothetical protein